MSIRRSALKMNQVTRDTLIGVLIAFLVLGSGLGGFMAGRQSVNGSYSLVTKAVNPISPPTAKNRPDLSLFWQGYDVVNQNFYGKLDASQQIEGALAGMVASLKDPYTTYFGPSQNKLFRSDLEGSFGGIGAELIVKDGALTVVAALDGTPADKAGLKGQDIIIEIDGKKTSGMVFNDAVDKIRGDKGTTVELTIARRGVEQPFKVKLVRDTIVVKSVKTSAIGPDNSLTYIKVNQFGQDTVELFTAALNDAKTSGKKGLVIDLRNNPGGYLTAAVQMIGMVIPAQVDSLEQKLRDRVAVLERSKDGHEDATRATNPPLISDLPIVVVVNSGSASASEIFSGAMKDYKRATVIGTKTFGKGSVQNLIDLDNHGSIKVTIAKWFTPLGVGIDGKGIDPDIQVELPANTDLSTSDPQVMKAIDLIEQKIK